ncbi:class E basic helix-loop-helix protein 40 [Hippoglossus hippoglossus]|uniref:class E basic helix-loop-helix protein 40 n=1 Tax=Hippoglossus hippoglossus TaxID=8267 RepID=UPI00148B6DCB|nr:class E basic helix-loop-helix protein 40 [Hippoglossus hippoglossus]XP_035008101.1 class E basic helix-loop-helix protein 40 [Hippoglossus stenolepis]
MERITSAQPPPCVPKHPSLDIADMPGMDFPIYVYKPRRGMKRVDESKETYKLPHRLIEKKRRDRINECIAQLKDLLPEHLKLTTLGHLEKAVVLELTLKHVKALSTLLDQQQQKIMALQKDLQISDHGGDGAENSEEMFRSGFHLCAKEVLHYLANQESSRDLTASHVIGHIQKVAAEVLQHQSSLHPEESVPQATVKVKQSAGQPPRASEGTAKNCVPVIQRTYPHGTGEQSGSDTDTDSGYGGERDPKAQWSESHAREGGLKHASSECTTGVIKQEGDEPHAKKSRSDSTEDEIPAGHTAGVPGSYMSFSPNQPPFCLPFYLIPPAAAAAAAYLPMLEKCWYTGGMPVMYPGMNVSSVSLPLETLPSSLVMSSRGGSPVPHHAAMDSPALHKALKQVPPLNLETKD